MDLVTRVQQQLGKLNPSDRRALLIVTVFLLCVGGYVYLIEPLLIRFDQAQTSWSNLTDQQNRYQRQVRMLPRREAKLSEYRTQLAALQRHFKLQAESPEAAVSDSIAEITYYARLADVTISGMRPLDAVTVAHYVDIPLDVEAVAQYDDLRNFLYYIDTSPSLMAITDVELTLESADLVQARLKLSNIILTDNTNTTPVAHAVAPTDRLQLVISSWTGFAPLIIAQQRGYLDSATTQIEFLVVDDKVTTERLLLSGEADGIGTSLPGLLDHWVQGLPLQIILPLERADGSEGIVVQAQSPVATLADLRQQTVAVPPQSILQFVLFRALQTVDLSLSQIRIKPLDAGQIAREISSGTLDVGVTREPYLSRLLASDQVRSLYISHDLQDLVIHVLALTPKAIAEKAAAAQLLIEGLLRAQRWMVEQPEQALDIIAEWQNQPPEAVQKNLTKLAFFDAEQIQEFFEPAVFAQWLATFEDYFEQTQQPFPLITQEDIVAPQFFNSTAQRRALSATKSHER